MKSRVLITVVTIFALVGVVAFIAKPDLLKNSLDEEVFKLTYQFLLIVVVGGLLSLLYKQLEVEREHTAKQREKDATQRDAERNLQRELHTDVVRAYHTAKKIRRLLRAKAAEYIPGTVTTMIYPAPYDEQMQQLIDTQLDFEFFVHRVRSNPTLFSSAPDLETNFETVEKYLNHIVSEYEGSLTRFTQQQGRVPLSSLPHLQEFIGPYKSATVFKSDFKAPFQSAMSKLETLIATP